MPCVNADNCQGRAGRCFFPDSSRNRIDSAPFFRVTYPTNAIFLKPVSIEDLGRYGVGGSPLLPAPLPLHHLSQRRSGADGAIVELVVGAQGYHLAQTP